MPICLGYKLHSQSLLPPPIDISATNVSTLGGSGSITGQNFVSGAIASVNIGGVDIPLTVSFVNSAKLNFTLAAGTYAAGTYFVKVTNPDGQYDNENIFEISAVSDPSTILGATLYAWYRADSGVTTSSGVVTQWNDKSGNVKHLTASGSARPTFNATSANFNSQPSMTFDGVANILTTTVSASLGTNTVFAYIICRAANNSPCIITEAKNGTITAGIEVTSSHTYNFNYHSGGANQYCTGSFAAPVATSIGLYGYSLGTGANAETTGFNHSNLTEFPGTFATTEPPTTTWNLSVGGNNAGVNFAATEVVEVFYANAVPNSSQLNQLYTYANFRYSLDAQLVYTRSLNMLATTGTESRIAGSGFNPSTAVSVVISGTPTAVTTTYLNAGSVSLSSIPTLAAGQYDLIVANANSGNAIAISKGLNVTATKQPDTIFGRKLVIWARADQVALNGSTISAYTDLACIGNAIIQATAANQPTWTSSDSNFNNQSTAQYTGSPVGMACTGVTFDTGTHSEWAATVTRQTSNAADGVIDNYGDNCEIQALHTVRSRPNGGGTVVNWTGGGTVVNTKIKTYHSSTDAGGSNVTVTLNVNFGTEVAVTQAGTRVNSGGTCNEGWNGSTNYYIGNLGEHILLDGIPTSGQIADYQSYLGRF